MTVQELGQDEELSVTQAASLLGINHKTIREAIHKGELEAVIPRGRDATMTGRLGYRIKRADLHGWWFGRSTVPAEGYKRKKKEAHR